MTTCSAGSLAVGEQLVGSAPQAVAWVALEQNGPWGARAFTQSHLDPGVGAEIESAAAAHGVRPALVRRPGRHADRHLPGGDEPRAVLVAHTDPAGTWLLEGTVRDPADVLALDWSALAAGDITRVAVSLPGLRESDRQHLLVCTNGKRDVCCATLGRPVVLAVDESFPGQVWEVTHTSGHRFAPTGILLPHGVLHGRLDTAAATDVLLRAAKGELRTEGLRGRSTWPGPAQVAEAAVRERTGETGIDALRVASHEQVSERAWRTRVRHRDGRGWLVVVEATPAPGPRAESCGKDLKEFDHLVTHVGDE